MDKYKIYPKQFKRVNIPINPNQCFVLMPFDKTYDELYGTIKEELNNLSFICLRDDEITGAEPFINKVLTNILISQFVIVVLTDFRPNVLYELGITHTFKDIQNVLLIVEKDSSLKNSIHERSSDISHLTYIEYDPNNLIKLRAEIRKFISKNKNYSDFQNVLKTRGLVSIITENNNDFIEYLYNKLATNINIVIDLLLRDIGDFSSADIEKIYILFENIIENAYNEHNDQYINPILMIYADIICSCSNMNSSVSDVYLNRLLDTFWLKFDINDTLIIQYKTDLVIYLATNKCLLEIVMPWIINYFKRSKTSAIDLNRYKLESFLMTTQYDEVNSAISYAVLNDNRYIREHMSDIIGEKRILSAIDILIQQLDKEERNFAAVSIIEAIGKLGFSRGVDAIIKWINKHEEYIIKTREDFVFNHAIRAIVKLKNTNNENQINEFVMRCKENIKDKNFF